jgi:ubiquinol-cytochrome c reductase cytochrome c1 subunit
LGISEENMREHLIFTGRKFGDTMAVAMTVEQGKEWFGAPPPDLSVRARSRGADWIYSFLKTFYVDESAIRGVNNLQFPGTSMPHVLWELQGLQTLAADDHHVEKDAHADDGHGSHQKELFDIAVPGKMTAEEYDQAVVDIVNFMVYMAQPIQLKRQTIGVGVLFFLAALGVLAYFMKRDYWKDVH